MSPEVKSWERLCRPSLHLRAFLLGAITLLGCGNGPSPSADAGRGADSGSADAGSGTSVSRDAGSVDAGSLQDAGYAAACTEDSQCAFGPMPYCTCLEGTACQCTSNCSSASDCGPGFTCAAALSSTVDGGFLNGCVQTCTSDDDCAGGFACNQTFATTVDGGLGVRTCALGCDNAEDCATGFCDALTGDCLPAAAPDAGTGDAGSADSGVLATTHVDSCTPYDAGPPTCSPAAEQMVWAAMDGKPIALPGMAAGLNLEQDGGLPIAQVDQALCQGTSMGDAFDDGFQDSVFGTHEEVDVEYDCAGRASYVGLGVFGSGYMGTLTLTSPDGTTVYTLSLNTNASMMEQIGTGAPVPFRLKVPGDMTGAGGTAVVTPDELYRAIMSTSFHEAWAADPEPEGTTCDATGACIVGQFASYYAYLYVPAAGFGFWASGILSSAEYINRMDVYRL